MNDRTRIQEMDFNIGIITKQIREWIYIYQNLDPRAEAVQDLLQRGFDNITNWVDQNRELFVNKKELLPRIYFNQKRNIRARRYTPSSSVSTYITNLGEFLREKDSFTDKDRELEIEQFRGKYNGYRKS